jgi:hypothetical protein
VSTTTAAGIRTTTSTTYYYITDSSIIERITAAGKLASLGAASQSVLRIRRILTTIWSSMVISAAATAADTSVKCSPT